MYCRVGNEIEIDADADPDVARAVISISAPTKDAMYIRQGNIVHDDGMYYGLRPYARYVGQFEDWHLYNEDCGTIIADTSVVNMTLMLPTALWSAAGCNFEIHKIGANSLTISGNNIRLKGVTQNAHTVTNECFIKLVYIDSTETWYMTVIE